MILCPISSVVEERRVEFHIHVCGVPLAGFTAMEFHSTPSIPSSGILERSRVQR